MPPVKKIPHDRQQHYLRAWRKFRGMSQEEAADRVSISRSLLSKIEAGDIPYNQDLMERLGEAYNCAVADLVSRDPKAPTRIPIFDLPKGDADRVYEFIRALQVSRTEIDGTPTSELKPGKTTTKRASRPRKETA